MCDMTGSYMWHDSFICEAWHHFAWHDLFMHVTRLIHLCGMIRRILESASNSIEMTYSYVCHDQFICATWLIHMRDMTHSYVRHDSFIWLIAWLIEYALNRHQNTRCCVAQRLFCDSFVCATWQIHVWRDSNICAHRICAGLASR